MKYALTEDGHFIQLGRYSKFRGRLGCKITYSAAHKEFVKSEPEYFEESRLTMLATPDARESFQVEKRHAEAEAEGAAGDFMKEFLGE